MLHANHVSIVNTKCAIRETRPAHSFERALATNGVHASSCHCLSIVATTDLEAVFQMSDS